MVIEICQEETSDKRIPVGANSWQRQQQADNGANSNNGNDSLDGNGSAADDLETSLR